MTLEWHERASEALRNYGLADARTRMLTLSENATYLVESAPPAVLRLNRPGFRTRRQIEAEVEWVEALRAAGVVRTPRTIPDLTGELVTRLPGGDEASGCALLMEHAPGRAADGAAVDMFATLGALSAAMHEHGIAHRSGSAPDRPTFELEDLVGGRCPYGHWSAHPGLDAASTAVLRRVEDTAARAAGANLAVGLIHGDMRAANLLVDDSGEVTVIDFDDCGRGWHMYELACALSFIEADDATPERVELWLQAYLRARPQATDDARAVPDLVMLRRLLLVAWLATRHHTTEAEALAAHFIPETVALGEAYLAGRYLDGIPSLLKEVPA